MSTIGRFVPPELVVASFPSMSPRHLLAMFCAMSFAAVNQGISDRGLMQLKETEERVDCV